MKRLSLAARLGFATAVVTGALVWVVIVDVGAYAGRIHGGVSVAGFDVGGMTLQEAEAALNDRRHLLRQQDICFETDSSDFSECTSPIEVGWFPDNATTARLAFDVGRINAPFGALADRVSCWWGGRSVPWARGPRFKLVTEILDWWEAELADGEETIDRSRFRFMIKRAVESPEADRLILSLTEERSSSRGNRLRTAIVEVK